MLDIKNLHARLEDGREILKGVDLSVAEGEVHAIMGPNGSGKSTLAAVLAGRDGYEVTQGSVTYRGRDLFSIAADERAREGVFLAFQYPVEIPGVNNMYFLRAALNAQRRHRGEPELDAGQFLRVVRQKLKLLDIGDDLLQRAVNVGFSGGEKKRNEIFQMAVLEPRLAILDETDSGLDIDALRIVARGVNGLRAPDRSIVLITHYKRLLDYIEPDRVHVLQDGRIVQSGGKELAAELERRGYGTFGEQPEVAASA
ncbi:MAG: Fe-S cluster assembly ATPase SufC [Alphaproteobacteria bacterium]|nr:Fe-S cluster assembly ATPase SufC [Alphaproteobacteria bacterium]MBV9153573.1 Fe-S cluster assembly ATPase SufC [Alphaproteobacteria bacterium]